MLTMKSSVEEIIASESIGDGYYFVDKSMQYTNDRIESSKYGDGYVW